MKKGMKSMQLVTDLQDRKFVQTNRGFFAGLKYELIEIKINFYDQLINAMLMIGSVMVAKKITVFGLSASKMSLDPVKQIAIMISVAILTYMFIKLLTLFYYGLLTIPVLIICLFKKGLYQRYSDWLTYRTSFRVLFLL